MGKAGRFACIITPLALTLASIICLGLVMSGQLNKGSSVQRDLYFFKADTRGFVDDPESVVEDIAENVNIDNELLKALQSSVKTGELKAFYQVGLWNYCEGDIDNDNKSTITDCSDRKSNFWFNPLDVWDLQNTTAQQMIDNEDLQNGLDVYHKAAKWMFTAFMIAIIATAIEFVVGILAIFSRWGSLATTIISTVSTVFTIAAAATSTAIYASLVGVFESVLKPYNIDSELGKNMMVVLWLGAAFSLASGFFWLISVCCCSGKSPHKKVTVEKTPYTYERVSSPAFGGQHAAHAHPGAPAGGHGMAGTAYEPFRQSHV